MRKTTRREILRGTAAAALVAGTAGSVARAFAADKPEKKAKRLLILGGTAFLGPELVAAAKAKGWTITLFNRGKTNPQLFPDLEKLHGDRENDLKSLE